jgi:hypothetical protein
VNLPRLRRTKSLKTNKTACPKRGEFTPFGLRAGEQVQRRRERLCRTRGHFL